MQRRWFDTQKCSLGTRCHGFHIHATHIHTHTQSDDSLSHSWCCVYAYSTGLSDSRVPYMTCPNHDIKHNTRLEMHQTHRVVSFSKHADTTTRSTSYSNLTRGKGTTKTTAHTPNEPTARYAHVRSLGCGCPVSWSEILRWGNPESVLAGSIRRAARSWRCRRPPPLT